MVVVVEGDDAGGLSGTGHHHPDVLADLLQVAHQVAVAGVEADPHPGEVRPLGKGVHGDHPVEAVFQDAATATGPGELHVALVGEDRHAVVTPPTGHCPEVVDAPGWIPGTVGPEDQGASASAGSTASSSSPPVGVNGRARPRQPASVAPIVYVGTTPAGRARCPDRVTAVAATAAACPRTPWSRRTPRPARGRPRPEPAGDPARRGLAEGERADALRVSPLAVRHREGGDDGGRRIVDRGPDGQVDDATGESPGDRHQPVQPIVRIRRRNEPGPDHDLTTNSARRPADASDRRARTRSRPGSSAVETTSPSR